MVDLHLEFSFFRSWRNCLQASPDKPAAPLPAWNITMADENDASVAQTASVTASPAIEKGKVAKGTKAGAPMGVEAPVAQTQTAGDAAKPARGKRRA